MMSAVIYFVWFALGIVYLVLWVSAYQHRVNTKDQLGSLSPYWCFCEELYSDEGKKICKKGKIVAIALGLLFVITWVEI